MKKIILFFFLLISMLFFTQEASASIFSQKKCPYNGNVANSLDGCLRWSSLVDASGPTLIEWNVKIQIINWTNAIAGFLWLVAVGAIVYGWLLMTLSVGEDEKIKKGKDIVKWALLGFLALITAWAIVRIVVELMYSFT